MINYIVQYVILSNKIDRLGAALVARSGTKTRTKWIESHSRNKQTRGEFNLYRELSSKNFAQYFRSSRSSFLELHELIKNDIKKKNTILRKSISSEERLAVCLR